MFKRSTIFLGLMLTGSLAAAALVGEEDASVVAALVPAASNQSSHREANEVRSPLPSLQLAKLTRAETSEPEQDPFAGKSWYIPPPPPPPQKVQEVPQPSAPPLPFHYMGQLHEEGEPVMVYLTQGTRAYSVHQGDTLDDTYRLDSVTPGQLVLTYLPLNIKQALNIAAPGMGALTDSSPSLPPLPPQTQDAGDFKQ